MFRLLGIQRLSCGKHVDNKRLEETFHIRLKKTWLSEKGREIHSAVPSRMKRKLFVSINSEGSLKLKRHDVVFTQPENNELEDKVDVVGCYHATIEETFDHETFEEDAKAALLSHEDGVNQRLMS